MEEINMDKEQYIKTFQDAIKINTENGNEKELAEYFQNLLKENGIESKLIEDDNDDKRASLFAEIENGDGKVLGLTGHLDVVSAGKEEDWTHPPFEGVIEDDVIWGRGASDMKGGVSALVHAFIHANEEQNFKGKIKLILTVGEEIGQLGAGKVTEEGLIDDVDAMIIAEPSNFGVAYAHKGSLNYKVVSKGLSSHSSAPQLGSNAVEHLADAIVRIKERLAEEADKYENDILGKTFNNITVVSGGEQVNSIPDYAEFEANARTIPEFNNKDVINVVKEVLDELNEEFGANLELEVTANLDPVETDPDSDLMKAILEVANKNENLKPSKIVTQMLEELGVDIEKFFENPKVREAAKKALEGKEDVVKPIELSGTTDAAQFTKANDKMNICVYGPGIPVLSHKTDERVELSQYLDFIELYKETIVEYLK